MLKRRISACLRSLYADEAGATFVEYALILTLIAVACIAALTLIETHIQTIFSTVGSDL